MRAIIIQARMESTRLPGKVLMNISNKPVLWYVLKRCQEAKVDKIVVATTTRPEDEKIVNFCKKNKTMCFRGSSEDVLQRYYQCAKKYKVTTIIRVTGDCPLIDASLINRALMVFLKSKVDYLSNTVKRTFPRGFDFETFSFEALAKAFKNAVSEYDREHVTPYIWKNRDNSYKIGYFTQKKDASKYRITVDTKEDFLVIKHLIVKYKANLLNYKEITKLLDNHPEIVRINQNIEQKS